MEVTVVTAVRVSATLTLAETPPPLLVITGATFGAARSDTAPISHWADVEKVPLIVTDAAPASVVDPPVMAACCCHHCRVCPAPGIPPEGMLCQYCTSITRSPLALAMSTEASVLSPLAPA